MSAGEPFPMARRHGGAAVVTLITMLGVPAANCRSSQFARNATLEDSAPVYDVSSVKENRSGSSGMRMRIHGGSLEAINISLRSLLGNAYLIVRPELIYGLPGWADDVRFDVFAKASDLDPAAAEKLTREQRALMLRRVLADRFQVRRHWETREEPIYELVLAKGGPKFKPTSPDSAQAKQTGGRGPSMSINNTSMTAYSATIASLAGVLARDAGRDVVDKTGLTGAYDFSLNWSRDVRRELATGDILANEIPAEPPIFAALQEQLGLKLQSGRGKVERLVIDRVERPSEN